MNRFARIAGIVFLLSPVPAIAQPAPAQPGRTETLPDAPRPPVVDTTVPGMSFRVVEGQGVFGLSRWVQASGRFVRETPQAFEALNRVTPVRGLTVVLDSGGGHLGAGLALGRALRAAGADTLVGRTVTRREGNRTIETLVTHGVPCHSACSYAFMGGVNRRLASTSRIGVHQFSQRLDAQGRALDPGFGVEEFRNAQEITARLAVYIQEMGVDARVLEIAATAPFGAPIRILNNREVQELRLATPAQVVQGERTPVGWSAHEVASAPMLYRLRTREGTGARRIDEELMFTCGPRPEAVVVVYRAITARLESRADELRATGIRISGGDRQTVWRRRDNEQPLTATGPNGSIFTQFLVERALVDAGARANRLGIEVAPGATFEARSEFGEGFGEAWPRLVSACEARARAAPAR